MFRNLRGEGSLCPQKGQACFLASTRAAGAGTDGPLPSSVIRVYLSHNTAMEAKGRTLQASVEFVFRGDGVHWVTGELLEKSPFMQSSQREGREMHPLCQEKKAGEEFQSGLQPHKLARLSASHGADI